MRKLKEVVGNKVKSVLVGLLIVVILVMAPSLPGVSTVAKAQSSKTFWGWQGYLGNGTIYLTTDSHPGYLINWSSVAQSNSTAPYEVGNALNFSLGTPGDKNGASGYSFYGVSGNLLITFYLAADSGSNISYLYSPSIRQIVPVNVYEQQTYVRIGNVPSNATGIITEYQNINDQGINETSTSTGKTQQFVENIILDSLGFLPVVGYAVSTYQTEQAIITYITPSSSVSAIKGPGTAYEIFSVTGGGTVSKYNIWQNVFSQGINVTVQIPPQWWSSNPTISLLAQNIINGPGGVGGGPENGATTYMNYTTTSNTAAMDGVVYAAGGGTQLSGVWVKIVDDANGTTYYAKTDSYGQFSFFGMPYTQYTLSTSYGTPWGTASWSTTTTTGGSGTSNDFGVYLGEEIYGQVTDSSNGNPIGSAAVHITAPNGAEHTVYTNSNGDYSVYTCLTGTYSIYATFDGYSSPTYSLDVASVGNNYQQDIQIGIQSGGCVLDGTMVYLSNYSEVPVQSLKVGDTLLSYNILSGTLSASDIVNTTITSIKVSDVHQIVSIDNGLLFVSGLLDQPLFARLQNGTVAPVLLGMLNSTMALYDAITNTWIPITSLQYLTGNFTVYDVVTSSSFAMHQPQANNYITGVGVLNIVKTT